VGGSGGTEQAPPARVLRPLTSTVQHPSPPHAHTPPAREPHPRMPPARSPRPRSPDGRLSPPRILLTRQPNARPTHPHPPKACPPPARPPNPRSPDARPLSKLKVEFVCEREGVCVCVCQCVRVCVRVCVCARARLLAILKHLGVGAAGIEAYASHREGVCESGRERVSKTWRGRAPLSRRPLNLPPSQRN